MNRIELQLLLKLVRREQGLLSLAAALFEEHQQRKQDHGITDCEVCRWYYASDLQVSVGEEVNDGNGA